MNGLPPHIAQVIAGHRNINVTMPVSRSSRTAPSRNSKSNFRRVSAIA
jgi:hypothetical protein